jgi:protein gp37
MTQWNPWHGCHKISAGCLNCYVYRIDSGFEKDASIVTKTRDFDLPVRKTKKGDYKIPSGNTVYTCFSSDFFLDTADDWRIQAWETIKQRKDLHFFIITKRIDRFNVNLPKDWGEGYLNVTICCTCENQDRADFRLPLFLELPILHKSIICEPLLEKIDLKKWLQPTIEKVVVCGESGAGARVCDYDWVLDIRSQCIEKNIPFHFKQTGANFRKNGKLYRIHRKDQHLQAAKAGLNYL